MKLLNKQYWQNNLWFGSNDRAQNLFEHRRVLLKTTDRRLATIAWAEPDKSRVWGIDTSHWDGNVDFSVTKSAGAAFAIIKCMDGTIGTRYWLENRRRAIAAGLATGEYCWLYPDRHVSCRAQAQAVWSLIKDQPKQLPLTVDFEWTKWQSTWSNPTYTDLNIFLTEFIRLSGYKPIVYTAAGFTNPMGPVPETIKAKVAGWWIANYNAPRPTMPMGVTEWLLWQFAATGEASKYAPNDTGKLELDLNYYAGTEAELRALAGLTATPPTNDGEPTNMTTFTGRAKTTSTPNVRIRRGNPDGTPNISGMTIGAIQAGQEFRADDARIASDGKEWVRVITVGGKVQNETGWSAGWLLEYTVPDPTPDPAPPPAPEPGAPPDYITAHWNATEQQSAFEKRYVPE